MLRLFSPDLFSSPRATWTDASGNAVREIEAVLLHYFSHFAFDAAPAQVGAFELNSSNFRVAVNGRTYLLKRWQLSANAALVEQQMNLLRHLHAVGVPVSCPVASLSGTHAVMHGARTWGLFEFVIGDYFQGTREELSSTGVCVGHLFQALQVFEGAGTFPAGPAHRSAADAETLAAYRGMRGVAWRQTLGDATASILEQGFEKIEETWHTILDARFSSVTQLVHYDLHPHNLLMAQGRPAAFLDFDACARMHPEFGIGFAALKLGRQAVAHAGDTGLAPEFAASFLDNVRQTYRGVVDPLTIKAAVQAEVMRRILLILRLNHEKSDRTWNHVLPVQIGHLFEVDALLG